MSKSSASIAPAVESTTPGVSSQGASQVPSERIGCRCSGRPEARARRVAADCQPPSTSRASRAPGRSVGRTTRRPDSAARPRTRSYAARLSADPSWATAISSTPRAASVDTTPRSELASGTPRASAGHRAGTVPPASTAAVAAARHSGPSPRVHVAVSAGVVPVSTANGSRCSGPCVTSTVPLPSGRSTTAHSPSVPGRGRARTRSSSSVPTRTGGPPPCAWVLSTRTRLGPGRAGATVTVKVTPSCRSRCTLGTPGVQCPPRTCCPPVRADHSRASESPVRCRSSEPRSAAYAAVPTRRPPMTTAAPRRSTERGRTTPLPDVAIGGDEQHRVRLRRTPVAVRPGRAVEVDARLAGPLVLEGLVQREPLVAPDVDQADPVVAVETGAGDEVVRVGDPPHLPGLVVVAVLAETQVVERAPVRAARRGQRRDDRRAVALGATPDRLLDGV